MRIRNSRLSCSTLPLPPEEAPRNTRFSSRGPCFDDRFLVEEVNRHIKWSSCPLRRTSDLDARAAQSHDQSQMALAGEAKSLNHVEREIGRENNMLESPSHVIYPSFTSSSLAFNLSLKAPFVSSFFLLSSIFLSWA